MLGFTFYIPTSLIIQKSPVFLHLYHKSKCRCCIPQKLVVVVIESTHSSCFIFVAKYLNDFFWEKATITLESIRWIPRWRSFLCISSNATYATFREITYNRTRVNRRLISIKSRFHLIAGERSPAVIFYKYDGKNDNLYICVYSGQEMINRRNTIAPVMYLYQVFWLVLYVFDDASIHNTVISHLP